MPEIAEVSRIVHFLRLHIVGKTIKRVISPDDANIFGKVGTSGPEFEKAVTGRKVVSSGNQGKYFWLEFDQPPHALLHFGMTGWLHIKGKRTAYTNYYNKMKPEERDLWPPKFWKFLLITDGPALEVAFTDPRRFGRVRLIDCPAAEIRKLPPLSENGPDPVVDTKAFTYEFFLGKTRSRHVPIKALLLDQAMISGIGNWVGDEVLFHARLHPEQYCDEFDDGQIRKLYDSIRYVCQTAVDKLGDSDEFPSDWLFKHRWDKGSKGATSTLPNGEKLAFITVGGRTSCYAPALQKKTGQITAGAKEAPLVSAEQPREKKVPSRKRKSDLSQTAGSNESQKRGKRSEPHGTLYKKAQDSRDDQLISKLGSPEAGRRRSGRVKAQSQRDKEGTR